MPASRAADIFELAEPQHGYFTAAQAKAAGIRPDAVVLMARRGAVERVSRGVYRIVRYPLHPYSQLIEASLWPQEGVRGVISHESALAFHGLSDVSPAGVHITLPRVHRVRRATPKHLVIHHADLSQEEVEVIDGVPVTAPERSILDGYEVHLGPALIRQAIEDGRRSGKLTYATAAALLARLLPDETRTSPAPATPGTP